MANNIAIRLGVEGGPELKRVFDDAGTAGQAAFTKVGAAADQAGAATDRQTAKFQRLAQAAREAEAQARAQSNVNALLGVGTASAGSARDSASVFETEMARQDQIRAARQEQNARTAQADINTLLGVRDAQVGAARASAAAFEEAHRAETDALRRTAEARTAVVRNTVAGWRDLGTSGAAALANIEAGRRLGSLNALPQPANQNEAGRRLRSDEITNLMYQGGDVAAQLGSGSPLSMIALQQGPQVAQIFAGPGGASVKGALEQAGNAAAGLAARIGPAGLALTALGAGVVTLTAAAWAFNSQQRELERTTFGVGRASGASLDMLNRAADAGADSGTISRRGARDIVSELNATGRVDPGVYADVAGNMRDLAKVMGVEVPEATQAVTEALSSGIGGFDKLNASLGLGGVALRTQVRDLYDSGRAFEAQRIIVDAYAKRVAEVTGRENPLSRLGDTLNPGRLGSNSFDLLGQIFGNSTSAADRLTAARTRLSGLEYARDAGLGWSPREFEGATAEVRRLEAAMGGAAEKGKQAKNDLTSLTLQPLLDSLNPAQRRLESLTSQAESFRRYLKEGGFDPEGTSRRAMDGLLIQARQLKEDMASGGAAFADALRSARVDGGLVGATMYGRGASGINEAADSRRVQAFRNAGTDTSSDVLDKQLLAIEDERKLRLDTLTRSQSLEMIQRGGAFSRAPSDLQAQILAASQRFPTVDPAVLAGLLEKEGGFYNTGPTRVLGRDGRPATTAWGRGQIIDDAEKDIRRIPGMEGFDKYNVDTQVMGAAAYLSLRQKWVGGDQIKALDGYGTGPGYGLDVMRRAGTLGDASSTGVARDIDAQTQAVERNREGLRLTTEMYGRNGAALESSTRAADLYRDMLARGVPPSEALRKSLEGYAMSAEQASRATRLVQFARDDDFAREQLGRDRIDQQAYATARARFGDTTSAEAVATIGRTRDTLGLTETKAMLTDGVTSFVSEFRRTGDAAGALSNAFGNAADRLLSKALDTAISGGFNSLIGSAGGGGSAGGLLDFLKTGSDFMKFDVGGYTGPGERYDVAGLVHRGEVVYSAADVARHGGVAAVEAFRRSPGLRGYADGGIVGREVFTTPRTFGLAPASAAGPSFGDINITMQGATGDPATDQAHVDATMKAFREEAVRIFQEQQAASLRTNGALWKAGVRRAR